MRYDMKKLEKTAKKMLSSKRFHHTECVVKQAEKLARIYGYNTEKAMVAAWMHDICKEMKQAEQLQWLTKFGIMLDSIQRSQPKTWHGMAACGFMKFEMGMTKPEHQSIANRLNFKISSKIPNSFVKMFMITGKW